MGFVLWKANDADCVHPLQPRSKEWPSWGVAFANHVDRVWMYGWEIHMVHVRWSPGQKGREKGDTSGSWLSAHYHVPAWNSNPNLAFLVILKVCLSSWRISYILFTSLLAWLITSKYLNIWYLGFYLYASSSPENVAGKPTDDVF